MAPEDRSENEKAAIAALKTIQTAQVQYYSQFGGYASSLRQLEERDASGKSTPEAAGLLDPELASGIKNGYRFTLEGRGVSAYATSAAQRFSARLEAELIFPIRPEWFTSIKGQTRPRNGCVRRNAAWHSNVDLIQPCESRSIPEPEDLIE
jgi:hypothetical protein